MLKHTAHTKHKKANGTRKTLHMQELYLGRWTEARMNVHALTYMVAPERNEKIM
jgi:hypothetical protein